MDFITEILEKTTRSNGKFFFFKWKNHLSVLEEGGEKEVSNEGEREPERKLREREALHLF